MEARHTYNTNHMTNQELVLFFMIFNRLLVFAYENVKRFDYRLHSELLFQILLVKNLGFFKYGWKKFVTKSLSNGLEVRVAPEIIY